MKNAKAALEEALATLHVLEACQLRRDRNTGDWMSVPPSIVNVTEMGEHEWGNTLFLWYGIDTPDLLPNYNGCGDGVLTYHDLDCEKGGLVTTRHSDLCDGIADLDIKSVTPSHVSDEPLIYPGRAVREGKAQMNMYPETTIHHLTGISRIRKRISLSTTSIREG